LLDQLREVLRYKHYSLRTEEAYLYWVKIFSAGTGVRLSEGVHLRVKDVDFDLRVLVVRDGKGGKDRVVMLPQSLGAALRSQLAHARTVWEHDRQQHQPGVELRSRWQPVKPPVRWML
jgi:integrase